MIMHQAPVRFTNKKVASVAGEFIQAISREIINFQITLTSAQSDCFNITKMTFGERTNTIELRWRKVDPPLSNFTPSALVNKQSSKGSKDKLGGEWKEK